MAPSMDIDDNVDKKSKSTTAAKKVGTPSASSEEASPHPDMSLAQDIHRVMMVHSSTLSVEDATAIVGMDPAALLDKVISRVGTGGKSVEEAIKENEAKYNKTEEDSTEDKKKDEEEDSDKTEEIVEPLLNAALYRHLQSTLGYNKSDALSEVNLTAIEAHHEAIIKILRENITKAKDEAGDMEVLHAHMDVARYCAKCTTKEMALSAYEEVVALPKLSIGKKLDAYLEMTRVCSFWGDWKSMNETLTKAAKVIEKGGDWDRRNRLKAYQAMSYLCSRDLKSASTLLVEGIATFSCAELCEYSEFIMYAIVTNLLYLKRTEVKKSIIDGSEILQVSKDIPVVMQLANTLYECDYKAYLHTLVDLQPHLVANRYLQPHAGYILRELHVLAFQQFLDSYQSVTLESMATSFGVGVEFLDLQLSRFIAAGRLTAKIDKYGGVVETNRPDWKNARYQEMIQKGDLLLNRIQKLGRVVDL
ncbi:26S proteasome regulatory subunit RPN7 [Skeletonema marinoi]|uniref:26S proteasome regulatory subunit RPN7 n=2 Tax=Skeletonema marinoi TaxID=267567 RepID=A0AAD8YM56_9STRA|nr:26S proteasome regulatory subunit RPN7 [Skeletonema marinoi]